VVRAGGEERGSGFCSQWGERGGYEGRCLHYNQSDQLRSGVGIVFKNREVCRSNPYHILISTYVSRGGGGVVFKGVGFITRRCQEKGKGKGKEERVASLRFFKRAAAKKGEKKKESVLLPF